MRQTFAHGTWLDPEEKAYSSPTGSPSGSQRKFKAIATFPGAAGKLVSGTAGVPDTFFSIPAIARIGKKRVRGYLTIDELRREDSDPTLFFKIPRHTGETAEEFERGVAEGYGRRNPDNVHIDIIQGRGAHHNPASRAAQRFISSKISRLAHEGYRDPSQRSAIAYGMARRRGFKIPRKNPVGKFAVVDHGAVIPSLGLRYTVQRLSGEPLHPLLPGQRIVAEGMTERMARQLAGSLNRPLRGNPRGVLFRKRRNPVLAVMGANPPHAAGDEINATWARIEYRRPDDPEGKRTVRVHDFEDGFVATPLADGSVLLKHPRGKHLWTRR